MSTLASSNICIQNTHVFLIIFVLVFRWIADPREQTVGILVTQDAFLYIYFTWEYQDSRTKVHVCLYIMQYHKLIIWFQIISINIIAFLHNLVRGSLIMKVKASFTEEIVWWYISVFTASINTNETTCLFHHSGIIYCVISVS